MLLFGIKSIIQRRLKPRVWNRSHLIFRTKRKKHLTINTKYNAKKRLKLATSFFDFNLPCPPEIKNCIELREYFKKEIEILKHYNLCMDCNISFLKENIISSFDVD